MIGTGLGEQAEALRGTGHGAQGRGAQAGGWGAQQGLAGRVGHPAWALGTGARRAAWACCWAGGLCTWCTQLVFDPV